MLGRVHRVYACVENIENIRVHVCRLLRFANEGVGSRRGLDKTPHSEQNEGSTSIIARKETQLLSLLARR